MKRITMYYYNKLRELNPGAAKTKEGRSQLMREAILTTDIYFKEAEL